MLTLAQQEAERSHHSYIGTEHLLLGLVRSDTEASRILHELNADEAAVRSRIEKVLGRQERIVIAQIVPTSRVKKVIELAFGMAQEEASSFVTTAHLLVALVREGEGIAAHVLDELGVTEGAISGARRGVLPHPPWPQPGERVLVHDPEPPHRLWEGLITTHEPGGKVVVVVPDHPTRQELRLESRELHHVPQRSTPDCERCRYRSSSGA